ARIGLLVGQLCNCVRKNKRASFRKSCMAQFRNETEELFQLSLRLRRLAKQDMDNEEMWNTVAESMPEATEKLTPAKRGADTAPSADKPNAKLKPLGFRWLDDRQIRPYERDRYVRKVDSVRN
ncbi:unnamed protein product, partial [Durusdinium trenchii]